MNIIPSWSSSIGGASPDRTAAGAGSFGPQVVGVEYSRDHVVDDALMAKTIKRAIPRDAEQPGGWIVRHAAIRPLLERGGECVLHSLFHEGQMPCADRARQCRDKLGRLPAKQIVEDSGDSPRWSWQNLHHERRRFPEQTFSNLAERQHSYDTPGT